MARNCLHCETGQGMDRIENATFSIEHAGLSTTLQGLSGWRCAACGEIEFDADSAQIYEAAGDGLVLRDRKRHAREIRRIRRKLGLSHIAPPPDRRRPQRLFPPMSTGKPRRCQPWSPCSGCWTNIRSC